MTAVESEHKGWLGRSVKRVEDARFIAGRGNYIEDIKLPNMLHMAILRSPFAHAKINSIDTSAATELPGVVAVVTGELLAEHNLAWMPTLSGDTQAVLATDKVRMQGQEVACVIAEDPYVAHDALELIYVDYDPLPVVISPQAALDPTAPVIRDDKEDQADNKVYHWEAGDAGGDREGVRRGGQGRPPRHPLSALPPRAARVLRLRRRRQPGDGQDDDLHDLPGAARAPHRVRARRRAAGAEHPDHLAGHRRRVRQQGADLSRLRGRDRRVAPARPAREVDRGSHRQPDLDRLRARLLYGRRARVQRGRDDDGPPREDALRPGLRVRRRAAVEVQGRALPHRHRLVRHPRRPRRHRGRVHEQGARRSRLPLLVPRHRGVVLHRAARPDRGVRARDRPGRAAPQELRPGGEVPLHVGDRLRVRLRELRAGTGPGAGTGRLRGAARGAEARPRGGSAARDRPRQLHGGRRGRAEPSVRHPRDQDVRLGRAARPSDRARRSSSSGSSPRARATRRRSRRSSRTRSASRPRTSPSRRATPTTRRTGLAPTPRARRRRPVRRRRSRRGRSATRLGSSPRTCSRRPRTTSNGRATSFPSRALRTGRRRSRRSPSLLTPTIQRGWRPGSRRRTTTTRRT